MTFVDVKVHGFFHWDILGVEGNISSKGIIHIQGCKHVCLSSEGCNAPGVKVSVFHRLGGKLIPKMHCTLHVNPSIAQLKGDNVSGLVCE